MLIELPKIRAILRGGVSMGAMLRAGTTVWQRETPEAPVTGTLWVGDYDDSSVTVTAVKVQGAEAVRLAAVPVGGGTEVETGLLAVDPTYRYARATITGLAAGTGYTIHLQSPGGTNSGLPGWCKTRPAARQAFKLGFATCGERTRNHPIYETILAQNPDMQAFLWLDDRGYFDITTNNVALYHQYDDQIFDQSRQASFHRRPVINIWGDHDYGANNSNGNSAVRPAALSWFRGRVPARPHLTGPDDPVYRVWSPMPGVKVALIDNRSDRYSTTAMLGAAQEAWLIGLLQTLAADEILLFSTAVPWISSSDNDTWFGAAAQRQRIGDAIQQYAPGRVYGIAGDMHALAYDDGTNSVGGFPIAHAAPLGRATSSKGGPYSAGSPIRATEQQYGVLQLTPITGGWTVVFTGYSVDSVGVQTQQITATATLRAPTQAAPAFEGTSTITGQTVEGATLTADPGPFSGVPTPDVAFEWRMDADPTVLDTDATFVRPDGEGGVPNVTITLSNGVGQPATRTVTADATTVPATPGGSATDTYRSAMLAHGPQFLLLNPGASAIPDESGNNRPATIAGTQGTHVAAGPFGLPAFRGTTSCSAFVPHDAAFNGTSWSMVFFAHPNASVVEFLGLFHRGGSQKLSTVTTVPSNVNYRFSSANTVNLNNALNATDWNFVAMTFDAATGTSRSYSANLTADLAMLNTQTVAGSLQSATDDVCFNGRKIGSTIDRRGNIALAGMARFAKVLTEVEIAAIYNATRSAA